MVAESGIGITYAKMGKRTEAQEILNDLLERSKQIYVPPSLLALISIVLDKKDDAFEWLEKAHEERDWMLSLLKIDFAYEDVYSDPRYLALLKKVGLDK